MIRILSLAISTVVLAVFISIASADAATPSPARLTAQDGIVQALTILKNREVVGDARGERLRDLMEDRLDWETFARLSIGPSWRDWTDEQRAQFVVEFKKHMLAVATKSTRKYDDQEVVIVGDDAEKNDDHTIRCRVLGKMKDGVQEDIGRLDFRLRAREDRWKVIDVHVAGISLANTFRAQFLVIIKDGGVDKLLKMMHERNAGGGNPPPTAGADK